MWGPRPLLVPPKLGPLQVFTISYFSLQCASHGMIGPAMTFQRQWWQMEMEGGLQIDFLLGGAFG